MKCQFSESAYAFSLVSELINKKKLGQIIAAPMAPSTREEAKEGYGYDVSLSRKGKPLFLQFKIPDYIVYKRPSSTSPFPAPFFRIKMWNKRISDQHNILKRLSDKHPGSVFYVAPSFYKSNDFDSHFRSSSICKNSAFFSLNNLPSIKDNGDHHIYYNRPGNHYSAKACFCSNPTFIDGFDFEFVKRAISQSNSVDIDEFCKETLRYLPDCMGRSGNISSIDNADNKMSSYQVLQNLLFSFGVVLVFLNDVIAPTSSLGR